MKLRRACLSDVDFIVAQEQRPDNAPYILQWERSVHEGNLNQRNFCYLIAERDDGTSAGYAILSGLASSNGSIELTRFVMSEPGRGEGRAACRVLLTFMFDTLGAHRVSLDLFENNQRAAYLYESLGFKREGLLREALRSGDGYRSLVIMSLLASEYRDRVREQR